MKTLIFLPAIFIFLPSIKCALLQTGVGINNIDFTDFKITENNLNHGVAHNVNGCSIRCLENFQCLSFSFNWKTNACEMWDEDFIHINATDGSADVGWIYYYIIRAHVNDGEVRIQGDRANITSTWRFDNGDLMKYFNWNTIDNQPSQTPTELSIVIRKSEGYRWHDAHIDYALSSVCHIY
ncbi:unnamed protein product [Mytilus edulis]|uniref:Apple domain-containing protein n=1 Tax=Mytilus edulis TaxID=6550 RepID=A0A8S3R7R4_MYTED|nr:unnamed protein product [Mytilus edulis]